MCPYRTLLAHVVMNFAAWAAGAGVAHLPEVVFRAHLKDAIFRHALRDPEVIGFGIARHTTFALEDRDVQLVFVDPKPFRRSDQLPGIGNRVFLEVIAETEKLPSISKNVWWRLVKPTFSRSLCLPPARTHFCEVVARVVGALFEAKKDIFELVHPRVGEQQRGIVGRDER